jgi:hypothetical protein
VACLNLDVERKKQKSNLTVSKASSSACEWNQQSNHKIAFSRPWIASTVLPLSGDKYCQAPSAGFFRTVSSLSSDFQALTGFISLTSCSASTIFRSPKIPYFSKMNSKGQTTPHGALCPIDESTGPSPQGLTGARAHCNGERLQAVAETAQQW